MKYGLIEEEERRRRVTQLVTEFPGEEKVAASYAATPTPLLRAIRARRIRNTPGSRRRLSRHSSRASRR